MFSPAKVSSELTYSTQNQHEDDLIELLDFDDNSVNPYGATQLINIGICKNSTPAIANLSTNL